jgi:hypothetical protein
MCRKLDSSRADPVALAEALGMLEAHQITRVIVGTYDPNRDLGQSC